MSVKWFSPEDKMPEIGETILAYPHFDHDTLRLLKRIDPKAVPFEILHEKMADDKEDEDDYNERAGFILGACYEFCNPGTYEHWEHFTKKDFETKFYLRKEITCWAKVPEVPKKWRDS
jgi:Fe-S-cluster formation regulator IscX/YfhJ